MSEFTPGPWHVFINDAGDEWTDWPISICPEQKDKSIVRPGGFYPYEWDEHTSKAEAVANARLIAAAPELYAALAELADLVDGAYNGEYDLDSFTTQVARAALSKDTGKDTDT